VHFICKAASALQMYSAHTVTLLVAAAAARIYWARKARGWQHRQGSMPTELCACNNCRLRTQGGEAAWKHVVYAWFAARLPAHVYTQHHALHVCMHGWMHLHVNRVAQASMAAADAPSCKCKTKPNNCAVLISGRTTALPCPVKLCLVATVGRCMQHS